MSSPGLSQALPPPLPRVWIDFARTLAALCVSLGLQDIPVMMMACQGRGPSTKQGLFVAELKHNWSHLRPRLTFQPLGL